MALKTVRLEPAYAGIDRDSSPNVVAKGKGQVVQNYLTGEKGRLRIRGALTDGGIIIGNGIAGSPHGSDIALFGFKDHVEADRRREPWVAPYKPTVAANLGISVSGANSLRKANLVSTPSLVLLSPTDRSSVPGPRYTRYGKWLYAIAYDSNSDTTNNIDGPIDNKRGGFERLTRIMRWDSLGAVSPVSYVWMPRAAQDIRVHYGRLLVLGGTDAHDTVALDAGSLATGVSLIRHNRLRYTRNLDASDFQLGISPTRDTTTGTAVLRAVGNVAPDTSAPVTSATENENIWNHEITGAPNIIDLPGDQSDFGVAMAAVGRNLAVLKRNSIVLLSGYGPATWQIKTAANGVGCLDPRSVVEAVDGCFFLSKQGFMFFDGSAVVNVSRGINRLLQVAALDAVGDNGTDGGYALATRIGNDHIMLTIGIAEYVSSGTPTIDVTFRGLFHIPSNSWSTFESVIDELHWSGATETRQYMVSSFDLYLADNITTPENVAESTRAIEDSDAIRTKWTSRTVELAAPYRKARLHRILVDYEWIVDGAADEANDGPDLYVCDGSGTVLQSFLAVGSGPNLKSGPADPAPGISRKRASFDLFCEANDIYVRIEYDSAVALALVQSAIHDVWIEYSEAQPKHGSTA